jgi:transcriptional regulator with XRE-family HTH domain
MTFGERLKEAILNADISQAALGRRLGVRACTVSKWVLDKHRPNVYLFVRMCESLKVDPGEFLDGLEWEEVG